MGNSGDTYSIDALLALYELEPRLRDVYVEGRTDAGLLSWFFRERSIDISVFAIDDRVDMPGGIVRDLKQDVNCRGRVISLAMVAKEKLPASQKSVTCVADADFARLVGPSPLVEDCLLLTDGPSMEHYAFKPRPLGKLLTATLHVDPTVTADAVRAAILPALRLVHCAQAVLFSFDISWVDPMKHCTFHTETSTANIGALIDGALGRVKANERPIDGMVLKEWATALADSSSPQVMGRGHDLAPALIKFLHVKGPLANVEALEGAMRATLEMADLEEEPLFQSLVSRVA